MLDFFPSDSWSRGAAAFFTAPFLISVGTGGAVQALPFEATGQTALVEVVNESRATEIKPFHERLASLQNVYQLGTDQLAVIMRVSRMAIYNWQSRRVGQVRGDNQARLDALEKLLRSSIPATYSSELGRFLRQRLDGDSQAALNILNGDDLGSPATVSLLSGVGNRLRGVHRNRQLEALLANQQR